MIPCDHKNTIVTAYTCPGYQAYCSACSLVGPPHRNPEDAVRKLEQQGLEEQRKFYYDQMIEYFRDVGFKDPFRLVEKPNAEAEAIFGSDIRNSPGVTIKQYMTIEDAQKFKEKLMATVTQTPYWIIVSDEEPADKPRRHASKQSAETEAQRLTEKHPGRTFTVFEAKTSYLTPKAETKKTEYREPVKDNFWPHQPRPFLYPWERPRNYYY